ncbi:MAG: hypothetical protein HDR13_13765 [Lachnospiraceae bacterium]|nr:hypothetical protein [Lachnospiraceae bacterium]
MNDSKTLLIHIGMPKTGSTALQSFLFNNNSNLEKYGWCYPFLEDGEIGYWGRWSAEKNGNGYRLHADWIINGIKAEWDKGMDTILDHLKEKSVIISSENIYGIGMDKFIEDARKKYENIKVIVYLRRQDRAIESLYNQRIKSGIEYATYYKAYNTFEEFIDSYVVSGKFLEYVSKLDLISQIVGRENLIVRIYEKQQLVGNDVITDFLSVLGIPSDQDDWKRGQRENFSLEGNYLEISRLINSVQNINGFRESMNGVSSWSDGEVKHDFYNVCTRLSDSFGGDRKECGFFSLDERKEFLGKFASDNEQIAKKYLHREDGILFYDNRMDFPLYEINQSSGFEADMIRVFTAIIYTQAQRYADLLEKTSGEIIGKLLMKDVWLKSKNRQVMLLGAGHNCRRLLGILGNISDFSIADNDKMKQGTVLNGIKVSYARNIVNWQKYFVIVTCQETREIEKQLCSFGLKKEEDYILMREYGL